ncbi:Diphthine--ammonia ligase [Sciurus carolinensis]|uniref:Diphthine--ammonia ligase n=1 Tax=Sciurus carolinensis TaxID=30640 RepID=A0AA41MUQ0_SCICA|nr:Diphthine--ammonia ligase [Sciurus carolinensis]
MMQCIAAGHQIVALANLRPDENQVGSDELDSYMYQTVGHHAIDLYAEAMALPLYRRTIRGRSLDIGQVYTKREGDEVEDLYELLKLVKEKEEVDGISVGAILSDYQHVRVENVCKRLNLQLLAYLWQRNQEDLLREMIASNIQAVIIKVAALAAHSPRQSLRVQVTLPVPPPPPRGSPPGVQEQWLRDQVTHRAPPPGRPPVFWSVRSEFKQLATQLLLWQPPVTLMQSLLDQATRRTSPFLRAAPRCSEAFALSLNSSPRSSSSGSRPEPQWLL